MTALANGGTLAIRARILSFDGDPRLDPGAVRFIEDGIVTVRDGLSTPELFTAPVLLRVDGELLAIDADGLILVDGAGERRSVHGARASFSGDPAAGPYYLLHPDRSIAALCA